MSFQLWSEGIRQRRYAEHHHIHLVRKQYNRLLDLEMFYPELVTHPANQYAQEAYKTGYKNTHGGTSWEPISGTFTEFMGFLQYEYEYGVWSTHPFYKRGRYSMGDPRDRHGHFFRHGPGYTRLPHHQPKGEPPKAAWREHKRFRRDKNKHKGYRGYNAGPWGKRMVHSKNRQHTRRMIEKERYDEVSQNVQDVVRCWWD